MPKYIIIKFICLVLLSSVVSCKNDVDKNESKEVKISKIELVLSKYGRTIDTSEDTLAIPKDELFEVYSITLMGKQMTTYKGYGDLKINAVSLNKIKDTATLKLNKTVSDSILKMAQRIYKENEYQTNASPTDSWLIDLKINDKHFVCYRGERLKVIGLDFINISNLMVENSALTIERYP